MVEDQIAFFLHPLFLIFQQSHARIQIVDHGLNATELSPPPLELLDQAAKVVGNSSFQLHLNSTVLATITQPNHQVRREKNKTEQPNQQNRSNMTTGKPSFKSARR
ncbi:hypothetical protein FGIG_04673 [Fasciola gigantica]|uniref:Uncharacterized protein n=1 Tax=Fasciola gigantica TaxID=46835 RepID=A0A504YXJ1_FASGI|nr:hypothetical protein FGIG_04673 [Fasciola gigantica]